MATTRAKKPTRPVKSLRAKNLSGKEAKGVKGGGTNTYLPTIQMADGSVRVMAGWDVKANKKS